MVMEGLQEDMGDGTMLCTDHPYKNSSSPGGICAFCLQEKLGKLVSSSFPAPIFPSSSSSSPPSFRSDFNGGSSSSTLAIKPNSSFPVSSSSSSSINPITLTSHGNTTNDCRFHDQDFARRTRIPFLLTQRRRKKKELAVAGSAAEQGNVVFKRSKSIATPRRRGGSVGDGGFLDGEMVEEYSPRRRRFWSFLYLTKHSSNRRIDNKQSLSSSTLGASSSNGSFSHRSIRETKKREEFVAVDENESPNEAAFERKVSRSRSVGCGSRSFSGDFFERISTGLGDCTLRRVESQREGKPKIESARRSAGYGGGRQDCIKERVKCGGIFGGFMITSSSSSSSSSSYLVSSSTEENKATVATPAAATAAGHLAHGRSKSWGWAFASPMRAFSKQSTTAKREAHNKNPTTTTNTTTTPNLNAIPSLLTVRS